MRYSATLITLLTLSVASAELKIHPQTATIQSPEASQQLVVMLAEKSGADKSGAEKSGERDVTRLAKWRVVGEPCVAVDANGRLTPLKDGVCRVEAEWNGQKSSAKITVAHFAQPKPLSFGSDVLPILTKAGCNAGGCHGKAEGQNGFKLSVFGFDTNHDYDALVKESRGRRVSLTRPYASLLLQKGAAIVPHGGGRKLVEGEYRFRRVLRWIQQGAPRGEIVQNQVSRISVWPPQSLLAEDETQQLIVTAELADGTTECVTAIAEFESNETQIANVDENGLIVPTGTPGEAAILVRYRGQVTVAMITVPRAGKPFGRPPENNVVDKHVWNKLQRLGIPPSGLCDDATFLRRVYLDTIGTLPSPKEARQFLADTSKDKRDQLIKSLLLRPEYADYWTLKWSDLLRVDRDVVTPAGAVAMSRWIRQQVSANRPYDEFVREIVTARGSTTDTGPAGFFVSMRKPDDFGKAVSQLFLGVRIECAQCHHHPSERWGQADYAAMAGFFTGIKQKSTTRGKTVIAIGGKDVPHPRTGELVPAKALGAKTADFTGRIDRREVLADWLVSKANDDFARMIANRLWAHYFGRGLVEPVDDMRATNPARNEELLNELAKRLRDMNFDLRKFTELLLNSRTYQLSAKTNERNHDDFQNFSHAYAKSLPAEVLLDAISDVTQSPHTFNGWPRGYRAIQLWDNRIPSYFFRVFGRPVRASVCECERSNEPSIAQALHLINSPELSEKLHDRLGRANKLAQSKASADEIVNELFLATLSRFPSKEERAKMVALFTGPESTRRAAAEDVLWVLINTKAFLFNH